MAGALCRGACRGLFALALLSAFSWPSAAQATTLLNLESGYQLTKQMRVNLEVFNLANTSASDIDYFFASRLPGEPLEGVDDIHFHPTPPRTARVTLVVGF